MMLNRLNTKGGRDMCFSCARPADEHHILRSVDELASAQLAHCRFVDLAGGEVVSGDVLVGWEAGSLYAGNLPEFRVFRGPDTDISPIAADLDVGLVNQD